MTSAPLLSGFGIAGFRSFGGAELQRIGPLSKVHLLAGPNNAGKSNALAVADRLLPKLGLTDAVNLEARDRPARDRQAYPVRLSVAHSLTTEAMKTLIGDNGMVSPHQIRDLFSGATFGPGSSDTFWFEYQPEIDEPNRATNWRPSDMQIQDVVSVGTSSDQRRPRVENITQWLTGSPAGNPEQNAKKLLQHISDALAIKTLVPPVATIGAFRQIAPGGNGVGEIELNGTGLIERLARLQRPEFENLADTARFDAVLRFVQTLLDDDSATLSIPQDARDILITHRGVPLPLANYGTGVQQIVIIAAAATVLENHLVCVEEPEIHLHPTMQRKLVRYLERETSNQYLIATHSAHFLDSNRASISGVRLEDGVTRVSPAVTAGEIAAVSSDLGFRASDLVQANAVIWVEGPSDRIYLSHWISAIDPGLVEGIHYSLMFYGGSLLSHLSSDDPSIDEFVALPRINRNFVVVIDSDRPKPRARVSATKQRVQREIEQAGPRTAVWMTKGYTIENYVPPLVLRDAVEVIHPGTICRWAGDPHQNPLGIGNIIGARKTVDKPAIARRATKTWPEGEWPLDLKQQATKLVALIKRSNED